MTADSATMTRVTIRKAAAVDASAIRDVYLAARLSAMPWLPIIHAPDEVKTWLETYVLPFSKVFVAEEGGRLVGFAALKDDMLDHLYVRPDHQRHGTGAALLNAIKTESNERLRLYTFARNTLAKRFYEKHGFKALAFSDGQRNEEREPDILLELEIQPQPVG